MNVTTIAFTSSTPEVPQYVFGDRVAVTDTCEPQDWATGRVVGLRIDEVYQPGWWYTVQLDLPNGFAEEYIQTDLVPEVQISALQEQWRLEA
ncbi:hypothetical protein QH73_0011780 [Scytonema millei VB511283]|uniref:Uncharacterized protein n=1 Tax=Scytonema millei VB511283 TaxID=1245923 RepID=A0A9X5E4R4_9CYAN|nr:hypothetical protein [Scytonema millei VB511283]